MPVLAEVERADIEAGRLSGVVEGLEAMSGDTGMLGSLILVFSGYDDDPREVWEIPEARRWFARLTEAVPHLLYLLDPEAGMARLYFALLMPSLDRGYLIPALKQTFAAANASMSAAGIDLADPTVAEITNRIVRSLAA